jgi:opacity protein-like surface antigen
VDIYQARKTEWLFLTNVYFDLGTWWGVTPFLGAGIGTARVNISNFTDSGAVSPYIDGISCTATAPCPGVYPGFATAESGSKWNFAWATHAGLAYQINSSTTLELAYSYINLGSGTTGVISDFTGYNGGNVMKFKDITSHDLKFGVRWMLDAPTSWLTPPLSGG